MITAGEAQDVVVAVAAAASRRALSVSIAIVDASGYLVSALRMDGAGFLTPQIAEAKAFTAAAWGKPTSTVAERARAAPETFQAFINLGRTQVVPGKGGVPLKRHDRVVGAVGVSGASADEDDELCQDALAAFEAMGAGSLASPEKSSLTPGDRHGR